MEEWKRVVGNEEDYEVSNTGKIRNIHTGKVLKNGVSQNGYLKVELGYKNPKCKSVHRIVAETFIPNPNNYPVINHKDEDKTNNNINNLEWCTQKHNVNYGEKSKIKNSKIIQCDKDGNILKIWESMKDASEHYDINFQQISACCRGKRITCIGYKWFFANVYNLNVSKHKCKA